MNAQSLFDHLTGSGLTLRAEGSALLVEPASTLTTETRRLIRSHKAELLRLAHAQPRKLEPAATFWKLRMIDGGKTWDVHTLPECTLAEARQLWPMAAHLEGLS